MSRHDATIRAVLLLILLGLAVIAVVFTFGGGDSTAPIDWNPNPACRAHGGIASAQGEDYTVAVVCRDGLYVPNPHD